MNLDFIHEMGLGSLVATIILSFIALLALGSFASLLITIKREREYRNASLPTLGVSEEVEVEEIVEVEEETAFDLEAAGEGSIDSSETSKLLTEFEDARKANSELSPSKSARRFSIGGK